MNGVKLNQVKNHPYHQQNHLADLLHYLIKKLGIAYMSLL